MIKLTLTQKGDALAVLQNFPAKAKRAAWQAQRDTLKRIRSEIIRQTTAKYYITAGRLRSAMELSGTTLKISGARQLIHHYKLSPTTRGKRPRAVMGAVKKGGLKPLGHNVFLMPTGNKVIAMARTSRKRTPLMNIVGPAVPQLASNPETLEAVEEVSEEYFSKRLEYWSMRAIGAVV